MTTSRPTLLVIDNDENLVSGLCTRFESLGYRCLTASSGAQGLSLFRSTKVDVVMTDLNMPAGNGVALAKAIREISIAPIIIVTGFHDDYNRELRSVTDVTVLKKPFRFQQLREIVEADLILHNIAVFPEDETI
ncbi:MAG TPA: response regulator [Phycisphaerales bacterium]|nr:response regulator [Phycisphaerales bacterium]